MSIALSLLFVVLAAPTPEVAPVIPIRAVVAAPDGVLAVDRSWLTARIERANAVFAPYGLQFRLASIVPSSAPLDAIVRADRDALARQIEPKVLNLFVVRRLMDIHEEGRVRRGVHWKVRRAGVHYVIMAAYAGEGILAHELGHFFGNPKHRHVPGNLMSYIPGLGLPTLDRDQQRRLKRSLRRFIRSGELVPWAPPTPASTPANGG